MTVRKHLSCINPWCSDDKLCVLCKPDEKPKPFGASDLAPRIVHISQLAASAAEPLLASIDAELLAKGYSRERATYWDDKVVALLGDSGKALAAIAWRPLLHRRSAFIALGGTREGYRQKGLYRACFLALVHELETNRPEIDVIESGHHIDNHESAAMHKALGRIQTGAVYDFPLTRRTDAR